MARSDFDNIPDVGKDDEDIFDIPVFPQNEEEISEVSQAEKCTNIRR